MSAKLVTAICLLTAWAQTSKAPTLRDLLSASDSKAVSLLSDSCLDARVLPKDAERYIHVGCQLSPSAEELFVFSRDNKLKGELYGWELLTLPDDSIVYHDSEAQFAPTHYLGISVYDPATASDKKIYPPVPYQAVRKDFIARVADVYKARGNDPELFNSDLQGTLILDAVRKEIAFTVRYGDTVPFTELVNVTCSPIDSLEQLHCSETRKP